MGNIDNYILVFFHQPLERHSHLPLLSAGDREEANRGCNRFSVDITFVLCEHHICGAEP